MTEQISRGAALAGTRPMAKWGTAAVVALCLAATGFLSARAPQTAGETALQPEQIEAIKDFATSATHAGDANFVVSMGAAVPQNVALQDMPRALGDALPAYINDQYLVVANRFVIVARNTRRIIAIAPAG